MNKKIVEDIQKRIEFHYGKGLFANILAFYLLFDGFHVIVSVWENEDQDLDYPDYCNGSNIASPPLVFCY